MNCAVTIGCVFSLRKRAERSLVFTLSLPHTGGRAIGTWLHVSVYDFLLKEGQVDVYDFMAGDARYKSQMRDKNTVYGRGVWFNSTVLSGKMIALAAKIKMWWSLKYRGNRCNIIKRY